jgi:low affinity Fe/Cu permease
MILKIIISAFVIAWIGIIYSIITAPLVDEYGNIIKEHKK